MMTARTSASLRQGLEGGSEIVLPGDVQTLGPQQRQGDDRSAVKALNTERRRICGAHVSWSFRFVLGILAAF
jgi:hypothetical protein